MSSSKGIKDVLKQSKIKAATFVPASTPLGPVLRSHKSKSDLQSTDIKDPCKTTPLNFASDISLPYHHQQIYPTPSTINSSTLKIIDETKPFKNLPAPPPRNSKNSIGKQSPVYQSSDASDTDEDTVKNPLIEVHEIPNHPPPRLYPDIENGISQTDINPSKQSYSAPTTGKKDTASDRKFRSAVPTPQHTITDPALVTDDTWRNATIHQLNSMYDELQNKLKEDSQRSLQNSHLSKRLISELEDSFSSPNRINRTERVQHSRPTTWPGQKKRMEHNIPFYSNTPTGPHISNQQDPNQSLLLSKEVNGIPQHLGPDIFKGYEKEDAESWWNRFKRFAAIRNWSEEEQLVAIPLYFKENAIVWYDGLSLEHTTSLPAFKEAFFDRYVSHPANRWNLIQKFSSKRQGLQEAASDFIQNMIKLGKELRKSEEEIVEQVIQGLSPKVSDFVLEKLPKTLDETMYLARLGESIVQRREPQTTATILALQSQIQNLHQELTNGMASIKQSQSEHPPAPTRNLEPYRHMPQPGERRYQNGPDSGRPREDRISNSKPTNPVPRNGIYPQNYGQRTQICFRCFRKHIPGVCPFVNAKCWNCGVIGHVSRACPAHPNAMK